MKTILNFIIFALITSCVVSCGKSSIIPDQDICEFDNLGTLEINSEKFQSIYTIHNLDDFYDNKRIFSFSITGTNEKACDGKKAQVVFAGTQKQSEPLDNTYQILAEGDTPINKIQISVGIYTTFIRSGTVTIKSLSDNRYKIDINGVSDEGDSYKISTTSKFSI